MFAWMIEAPGVMYLAPRKLGGYDFHWTGDAEQGLRFFSKEQCDLTMMAIRQLAPDLFNFERTLGNAWPVEHGWIDAATPSAGPVTDEVLPLVYEIVHEAWHSLDDSEELHDGRTAIDNEHYAELTRLFERLTELLDGKAPGYVGWEKPLNDLLHALAPRAKASAPEREGESVGMEEMGEMDKLVSEARFSAKMMRQDCADGNVVSVPINVARILEDCVRVLSPVGSKDGIDGLEDVGKTVAREARAASFDARTSASEAREFAAWYWVDRLCDIMLGIGGRQL